MDGKALADGKSSQWNTAERGVQENVEKRMDTRLLAGEGVVWQGSDQQAKNISR